MELGFLEITHTHTHTFIFHIVCGPHLARVMSFVLHHIGCENSSTDPGLSEVVAQFRHAEDARLHQTPARQIENMINTFICLYHYCCWHYF